MTKMTPIKGYEGLYSITDDGYVFGHKRKRYLTKVKHKDGRNIVSLYLNGKKTTLFVDKLVAETYLTNKNGYKFIGHRGDLTDDRAEMLFWSESLIKGLWEDGHYDDHYGEGNAMAKLTDEAVRDIRTSDEYLRVLAEKYGVSITAIYNVKHYKTWTKVTEK